MLTTPKTPEQKPTPRVDLLESLLAIYSEKQLTRLVMLSQHAKISSGLSQDRNGLFADVKIRFKAGVPRFLGVDLWEEAE